MNVYNSVVSGCGGGVLGAGPDLMGLLSALDGRLVIRVGLRDIGLIVDNSSAE